MKKFCSLVSSSRGNATLISDGKTNILVDCGISRARALAALDKVGMRGTDIDAILVTHEHTDHISGVGVMSRSFDIPVYANKKTWAAMRSTLGRIDEKNMNIIENGKEFAINDAVIKSFHTPHDAADSVGYILQMEKMRAAVATDMGKIDEQVLETVSGSDIVLLEANHDVDMLLNGPYPKQLKERILGDLGHLSNELSAEFAARLLKSGTRAILLGHLSEQNNEADVAYCAVREQLEREGAVLGKDIMLAVANRYEVSGMF